MEQQWIPAVAIISIVLVIGTTLVLRGPMGKALAEWIRGWSKTDQQWLAVAVQAAKQGAVPGTSESVLTEVEELKRRLAEVEERLDFTERLLARERDPERLARPR